MAEREEIIRSLNGLFAEEVEAAIRYLHLAVTLKGLDRLIVRKTLLDSMQETLEHAQTIADKIIQLGGAPQARLQMELPGEMQSGVDAIRTALAFEQAALDGYRELLDKAGGDIVLEEFVRAQIATESEHVSSLVLLQDD